MFFVFQTKIMKKLFVLLVQYECISATDLCILKNIDHYADFDFHFDTKNTKK